MEKASVLLFILFSACTARQNFSVNEITILNKADNISLAGILTLPDGEGPFPGVVLVPGTGPIDRDETFEGHKFFKVLAEYLATNGIASYRYDKRGVGGSTGDFSSVTIRDLSSDALAALKFIKDHPRINRAGFIGHSEGTKVTSMAIVNNDYCDFLVLMAPYALPGDQGFLNQTEAILSARGISKENIDKQLNIETQIWELLKQDGSLEATRIKVENLIRTNLDEYHYLKNITEEDIEEAITAEANFFVTALNIDEVRNYNHPFLSGLKCPVFALTGDKDLYVVYPNDFNRAKELIKSNSGIESTFKIYPSLNHMFQTCETGLYDEISQITETMNGQVMADIADWINELK